MQKENRGMKNLILLSCHFLENSGFVFILCIRVESLEPFHYK